MSGCWCHSYPGSWTHLHETIEPCNHLIPSTPPLSALYEMLVGMGRLCSETWPQHYILLNDALQYKETPPVITLSYLHSICVTYRGAVTSCELDVALDYISAECFLSLRLAITIITFLASQDRSAAAHKVKMSWGFSGYEEVWRESLVRGFCAQGRVCFWHGVWRGAARRPLPMNKTWAERATGVPAVHLPFARLAKAMEDD